MNKKGFTLIELLVAMAILGLLIALTVVALRDARKKAAIARGDGPIECKKVCEYKCK